MTKKIIWSIDICVDGENMISLEYESTEDDHEKPTMVENQHEKS